MNQIETMSCLHFKNDVVSFETQITFVYVRRKVCSYLCDSVVLLGQGVNAEAVKVNKITRP